MEKKGKDPFAEGSDLRRRAEQKLHDRKVGEPASRSPKESARLLHELEVHQIELEMQNEELVASRGAVERLLDKYTDLYEFAPIGYFTIDRAGTVLEVNLTGAKLLGVERTRIVNRPLGVFINPKDRPAFNTFLEKVFGYRAQASCEFALVNESAGVRLIHIEAPSSERARECRCMVTDITESRHAEDNQRVLSKLESTGILAGGMAHDFNNLLTAILGNIDMAQSTLPPGNEIDLYLEEAIEAVTAARDLTQQLITFASGGISVKTLTNLSDLIKTQVALALSGSSVKCDISLSENLWWGEIDAGLWGQVLRNIALNAREAMPSGGIVSVRAENVTLSFGEEAGTANILVGKDVGAVAPEMQAGTPALRALSTGDYVRVSILDRGTGITSEVLARIFDPYFSTKERGPQKGMGLGLTVCHSIATKNGGEISVESEVGTGTVFHVLIPASREVGRKEEEEERKAVPEALPRHGRILLMDDEEVVRKVMATILRHMGCEVELAADGQAAIDLFEKAKDLGCPFDAVILDLTVRGGMGGQDAVKALLKIDPSVKAIVSSGYSSDPMMSEYASHGFKAALAKPYTQKELRAILAEILGSD